MIKLVYIRFNIFLAFFSLCLPALVNAQNFNSRVQAAIQIDDAKDDILDITGTATNKTEENFSLSYELSVITSNGDNNNSSKNAQSGRFTLGPFETKSLSRTSVSVQPNHRTIILLLIYNEDKKVIGTDRIVYDANDDEKEGAQASFQKPNEGIKLRGMVTDKTKTKPGKDFYDFFYQQYLLSPNQIDDLLEIDEMISFGRTTRIMLKVDNRIIYQFFARPKLDYLKEKADEAMKQVNRYYEYLKNRNESLTKY